MRSVERLTALVVLCAVTSMSCGQVLPFFGGDTVSYRPDSAEQTDSADCLTVDEFASAAGLRPWDPSFAGAPLPGYPPRGFNAVEVVSCQKNLAEDGVETVDTVRLDGDVEAVAAAFSVDSLRFADGIMASCAYEVLPPAGLWLIDESGHAYRPVWPSRPCGLQDGPLAPLQALSEVERSVHRTGYDVGTYPRSCAGTPGPGAFYPTTADDVRAGNDQERTSESLLFAPIDDVGYLQVCRYPVRPVADPADGADVPTPGDSLALGKRESAALIGAVADAPIAPPCEQQASRHASTQLLRPDGSGGAMVFFELDGCRRAAGFGPYRKISDDVHVVLVRGLPATG